MSQRHSSSSLNGTAAVRSLSVPIDAQERAQWAKAADVAYPALIAHRGASFDAPESTAPSYLLARDAAADYLEMDIQRTRDGVLVVVHDDLLVRTTDIATLFPARVQQAVSDFTLAELGRLDAGSWYNVRYPERARASFKGLKILTLDEVIDIAEAGSACCSGRCPGLYIETKKPHHFPGIERDVRLKLQERGWLTPSAELAPNRRVIMQTFDRASLTILKDEMPNVPRLLLLWIGDAGMVARGASDIARETATEGRDKSVNVSASRAWDPAAYYASLEPESPEEFARWLDDACLHGAMGIGPSAALTHGGEQSYMDLIQPWMNRMAHERGLLIHVYTVDEEIDFEKAFAAGVDGIFTNRPAALSAYLGRPALPSSNEILLKNGY